MFVLATLVYPVLLAALCLGAGLLVDRCAGEHLPAMLLPPVGAAALIGVSQLTTYVTALASATPYVLIAVAAAGFLAARRRVVELVRRLPSSAYQVALPIVAYLLALAPVLLAGRLTFSGYGALPDSALHMIGADYLIRHGQEYAHLDLRNSYGQYIQSYFATSYPSGSHTLFGGTAVLLHVPLIWTLQSFCAFILATTTGPAWILARRLGLAGAGAALAALTVTLPALVYGYELVASLKELTTLPLILTLGALVMLHRSWLRAGATAGIPFALVVAAGVSSLGLAFGPWAVAAVGVLAVLVVDDLVAGRGSALRTASLAAVGAFVGLAAAWPTWSDAAGSLQVATGIASTSNPGNLTAPLRLEQVLGVWLSGSYRHQANAGVAREATYALIVVLGIAAGLGVVHMLRIRAWALAGWAGLVIALWLGLTAYGTTWTDAKLLMLTSPVVLLLAWAGVAALRSTPLPLVTPLMALAIIVGVIGSDAAQYHGNDLAPTARYQEMAYLNTRYAGRGPVLFTDFDEWSVYVLRDLDVGGPDFIFPPVGLVGVARNHGDPVDLDRISGPKLAAYPLIITRRDPTASRPPAAYQLAWEGRYYQVWARTPEAPIGLAHVRLQTTRPVSCARVRRLARIADHHHVQLVAAHPVDLVTVNVAHGLHPTWAIDHPPRVGLLMTPNGSLRASFSVPHAGRWSLWVQGEIMPRVTVSVDGRRVTEISDEVSGNAFNPDTTPPVVVTLAAGVHELTVSRGPSTSAPGDGGSAILHAVLLTPDGAHESLTTTGPARWRSLCGQHLDWLEATTLTA